ncbi:uncharacterized protein LOC114239866 [Bombyx mandarina]|uniref:Uncharacterized protein LOC114239866 n=1 Tax=Bombyx mandarina TaxID=7092 RepID=A0A6J2JC49_BOMMA|nr:uncharacterized protein LOC114239866 [Bombyx mandarina]
MYNVSVLRLIYMFLCLSFNSTFPMHRDSKRMMPFETHYVTHFKLCNKENQGTPFYRTKKMASNIENALKKIKDSTQDVGKNFQLFMNGKNKETSKNNLNDLTHYEQLVFMKKYPYLDLKEFEMKYRPASNKIARESFEFESGSHLRGDSSLCEPLEEGPNVEIFNRGLSGFTIPPRDNKGAEVFNNEKLYKQDAILKPQI